MEDTLLQDLAQCRDEAKAYDLFELQNLLNEILLIPLAGKSKRHVKLQREYYTSLVANIDPSLSDGCASWKREKVRRKYMEYAAMLKIALPDSNVDSDSDSDSNSNSNNINRTIALLGPNSQFDMQHQLQSMQEQMLKGMKDVDAAKEQSEFERTDPLQNLRSQEKGYNTAVLKIQACTNPNEADSLAKVAFASKKIWTAELYWKKAIGLSSSGSLLTRNAKFMSNIALVQIKIGRYLRSIDVGYRGIATQYLFDATKSAAKGIEIDPKWERSYQRGAEAFLALHSYEYSLEAMKVLKKAFENVSSPPSVILQELRQEARNNATQWLKLKIIKGKTTIPQAINASLQNLRNVVERSFPLCYRASAGNDGSATNDVNLREAGDSIADALLLVKGTLQLIHTRRLDFETDSRTIKQTPMDYQIQLRQIAKVFPLQVLPYSQKFQSIVFVEEPFTLWGLDKLDVLNVNFLSIDVYDPCESKRGENDELDELLNRKTGDSSMNSNSIFKFLEKLKGRKATSSESDMTNNHVCAFTMTVLERLLRSKHYSELSETSLRRIILFSNVNNKNVMEMGGEFFGRALKLACGAELGNEDFSMFFKFAGYKNGLCSIGREIYQGGDPNQTLQKFLCELPQRTWKTADEKDIFVILCEYALTSLEGGNLSLKVAEIEEYAIHVISNIFESLVLDDSFYLKGYFTFNGVGQYFTKRLANYQEEDICTGGKETFKSMFDEWKRMSKKKQAAYRWESKNEEEKEKLSKMKPVSRVEKFQMMQEGGKKPGTITKVSECEECGSRVVPLKCTCKLVYYCSKECQQKNWSTHRAIHKKALKKK